MAKTSNFIIFNEPFYKTLYLWIAFLTFVRLRTHTFLGYKSVSILDAKSSQKEGLHWTFTNCDKINLKNRHIFVNCRKYLCLNCNFITLIIQSLQSSGKLTRLFSCWEECKH